MSRPGTHCITLKDGSTHTVEEYGWDKKTAYVCIDNWKFRNLKMYFRYARTLDDYMGNTPCGYYIIVPFPDGFGTVERRRVYLDF